MYEKSLPELSLDFVLKLFGTLDGNVENIESAFSVSVVSRDGSVRISGENQSDVNMAVSCIRQLERISQKTESIDENTVNYVISMVREEKESELGAIYSDCICLTNRGKPIKAKTVGQQEYVDSISKNTIVFGVGSKPSRSAGSFSLALRWKRAKSSAFFPVISKIRSIPTSARFTMHWAKCSAPKASGLTVKRALWR